MASQINPQFEQQSHLLACTFHVLEDRSCKLVNISSMCRWYSCHFWRYELKDAVFQHASETLLLQGLYSVIWQSVNLICADNLLPVGGPKLLWIFIGIVRAISQQSAIPNKYRVNITFCRHMWGDVND